MSENHAGAGPVAGRTAAGLHQSGLRWLQAAIDGEPTEASSLEQAVAALAGAQIAQAHFLAAMSASDLAARNELAGHHG